MCRSAATKPTLWPKARPAAPLKPSWNGRGLERLGRSPSDPGFLDHPAALLTPLSDGDIEKSGAAVNPQRKLPALITPNGETLTESVAILLTRRWRH